MLSQFFKLQSMLIRPERFSIFFLIILLCIVALFETLGAASILPFMKFLTSPDIANQNEFTKYLFKLLEEPSHSVFTIVLGLIFILVLITTILLKTLSYWVQLKITKTIVHQMGCRLLTKYLNQPYIWFTDQHTSRLAANILNEIQQVISQGLFSYLQLFAHILVTVALTAFMFVVDPILAAGAISTLASAYLLIYFITYKPLKRQGAKRYKANHNRFKTINEIFAAIKEVKIRSIESKMIEKFIPTSYDTCKSEETIDLIKQIPGQFMQGIISIGAIVALIYLNIRYESITAAIPNLIAFGYAGYRLMPPMQQIYRKVAAIQSIRPSLEALHNEYHEMLQIQSQSLEVKTEQTIPFLNSITLENLHYKYPKAQKKSLTDVNLTINHNSKVGVVGSTGSGKTTLIDILMGLLTPSEGALKVDGISITQDNVVAWRNLIGYVPQNIHLTDDTIAANIAFGLNHNEIDMDQIKLAAGLAKISDFIENDLPDQYMAEVGERGTRLSGGQKQRIGIARALYHNPSVIVFDEATSALDNNTEKYVMDSIDGLSGLKTIIMIAHRITTIAKCDNVVMMENGQIIEQGTYEELMKNSEKFRALSSTPKGS